MLTLITNRKIVKEGNYFSTIKKAIEGGVDAIILREKDIPKEELQSIAEGVKEIIGERKVLLIINSNIEIAKAVEADGIQLSFDTFINEKLHVGFEGLVGVSVHSLQEALGAEMRGASYVLASHVFETACKAGLEPKGLRLIKEIKEKVSIPVIALGGITPENVKDVMDLGVEGVAVMSGIMAAEDVFEVVEMFKKMMS
ncbi:thiamine phosphate synthase [Alkaliphilus hydrothermalis]|uniref:Thiamine-phosphate synthase n=1 Tax=Alkaliphilus hydrothermalis TaxID=1482730 RepID=A0ABS2NSR7_9FIRM|nr:thiamine phosphate synthase [Alkaliphilus hydrothermalis]MBM7615876.1 thiamine-phosphate pyrophosphorylase [Alkaliphilus hydrothermalis]